MKFSFIIQVFSVLQFHLMDGRRMQAAAIQLGTKNN